MSRTSKFAYNSISTAIYQIFLLLTGIIVPRVMLECYGSEINGLVTSITQFITYFNLVEAGLAGASIYALYKPLADSNYNSINRIICATKKFYDKAGWIFVALIVVLAFLYPMFANTQLLSGIEIFILVLILGAKGVLEFFTLGKYRALLSADQKTYVISLASILYQLVYTLIIVIFAYSGVNVIALYALSVIAIMLRSIILVIYTKKKYSYINYNVEPDYKSLNKRHDALFLQILGVVQTGAPIVIATFIIKDLKLVSVYSIFNMVLAGINSILGIFTSGLSASFGDIIVRKEESTLKNAYSQFELVYYSTLAVVYSITFIMIMPFINIYTSGITDINYNIPILGVLFALNGFLYNLKTPQGMLVIAGGLYKETRIQTSIQALILVIGGVILSFEFGLVGILIASCLSNLYRIIDLVIFIPKNVTKLKVVNTVKRIIELIVSCIFIISPCLFININPVNYYEWILYSICVGLYAMCVVAIIDVIFEIRDLTGIINRVKGMFNKFRKAKVN